jgi:hypothetical protein
MRVICAHHNKDVDVVLLSVLLCMLLWLQVLPCCQSSCVLDLSVYVDIIILTYSATILARHLMIAVYGRNM